MRAYLDLYEVMFYLYMSTMDVFFYKYIYLENSFQDNVILSLFFT
jgi:hypothetical protein